MMNSHLLVAVMLPGFLLGPASAGDKKPDECNKQPRFRYWPKADKARATTSIGSIGLVMATWGVAECPTFIFGANRSSRSISSLKVLEHTVRCEP